MLQQEALECSQSTSKSETAVVQPRMLTNKETVQRYLNHVRLQMKDGIDLSWDSSPEQMEVSFFQKSLERNNSRSDDAMRNVIEAQS